MIKNPTGGRALNALFDPSVRPIIKKAPVALTDIRHITLKTCRPHVMRLTAGACALMAERARNAGMRMKNETTPYARHSANAEKERLKACVDCPTAETLSASMRKAVCQIPNCNRVVYQDGLCERDWFKRRAKEENP